MSTTTPSNEKAVPLVALPVDLRDYFAARALPLAIQALNNPRNNPADDDFVWGCLDDGGGASSDQCLAAEYAYSMADAMLIARQS